MKRIKTYEGKRVIVVGLAKSGLNAARLLKKIRRNCNGIRSATIGR